MEGPLRLIFSDEAGTSAKEPVCVVAAVIVDGDRQLRDLESAIKSIIKDQVPTELQTGFYIHATDIFSGGKSIPRDKWPFEERLSFLKTIAALPRIHNAPIAVSIGFKREWPPETLSKFHTPNKKPIDNNNFTHFLTFAKCMEKADLFLRKYLNGSENGMIIAEDIEDMRSFLTDFGLIYRDSKAKVTLDSDMLKPEWWQELLNQKPDPITYRIDHIVGVPHFVKKGNAPLLQLADVCAFSFRHCLTKKLGGNDLVIAMLGPSAERNFINDPVWFSDASSGLFNTSSYWSAEQRARYHETQRALILKSSSIKFNLNSNFYQAFLQNYSENEN